MAKVRATYVTGKTVIAEAQNIDTEQWLVPNADPEVDSTQEDYDADNDAAGDYQFPVADEIGSKGVYEGDFPLVAIADRPAKFRVYFTDTATMRVVGAGEITISAEGNEIDIEDTIFAGAAGLSEGIGTDNELYRGATGKVRIDTTFDSSGNRDEVIHSGDE